MDWWLSRYLIRVKYMTVADVMNFDFYSSNFFDQYYHPDSFSQQKDMIETLGNRSGYVESAPVLLLHSHYIGVHFKILDQKIWWQ